MASKSFALIAVVALLWAASLAGFCQYAPTCGGDTPNYTLAVPSEQAQTNQAAVTAQQPAVANARAQVNIYGTSYRGGSSHSSRGRRGPTGYSGRQGYQGPQGPVGPQGLQGVQGPQGVSGSPGRETDLPTQLEIWKGDDPSRLDYVGPAGTALSVRYKPNYWPWVIGAGIVALALGLLSRRGGDGGGGQTVNFNNYGGGGQQVQPGQTQQQVQRADTVQAQPNQTTKGAAPQGQPFSATDSAQSAAQPNQQATIVIQAQPLHSPDPGTIASKVSVSAAEKGPTAKDFWKVIEKTLENLSTRPQQGSGGEKKKKQQQKGQAKTT